MESRVYTLQMDYSDEHDRLIGYVYGFPKQLLDAANTADLFVKAKAFILHNIRANGGTPDDESFTIETVYGRGFIHKKRREDPEVALFLDLLNHYIELGKASFQSADKFASIAANSLIYLNGGAVIAILTFYGNILTNISAKPDGMNLTYGVTGFAAGLFCAVLACCFGFLSQNEQTREHSHATQLYVACFRKAIFFTDLIDINKHLKEIDEAIKSIPHKSIVSSGTLRKIATLFGFVSLGAFVFGGIYSMLSLHQLWQG